MCVICPVSSNTITDVEMVCVTAADMAAAPRDKQYVHSLLSSLTLPKILDLMLSGISNMAPSLG